MVEQHATSVCPGEVETIDLLAGLGRVLAEGILADRDFPPFARATRDGYAVRAADLALVPAWLEVVDEVKAGDWPEPGVCSVGRGQAVGIMTGAPLPAGADAVVMVEYTSLLADQLALASGQVGGSAARRQRRRELCSARSGSSRGTAVAGSRTAAGPCGHCDCGVGG